MPRSGCIRASPSLEPPRRNLLWVLFADPFTRELIVDWDIHARQALAEFRSATSAVRHDPAMIDLVEMLRDESEEFDRWWPEHDVSGFETRLRRFNHPTAGELTFQYQQLTPAEWPSLRVVAQLGRSPATTPPNASRSATTWSEPPESRVPRPGQAVSAASSSSRVGGSAPWRVTTIDAAAWATSTAATSASKPPGPARSARDRAGIPRPAIHVAISAPTNVSPAPIVSTTGSREVDGRRSR